MSKALTFLILILIPSLAWSARTPSSGLTCTGISLINPKDIKSVCYPELIRKVESQACFFGDAHHVANLIYGMRFDAEKLEFIAASKADEKLDVIIYKYVHLDRLPGQSFELKRCPPTN